MNPKMASTTIGASTSPHQGQWNTKIAKASGAKEAWSARGAMPTSHLLGGTIMGTSATNSVVNSYGQSHEIPNLWIAGPGIFPTEGASTPGTRAVRRSVMLLIGVWPQPFLARIGPSVADVVARVVKH